MVLGEKVYPWDDKLIRRFLEELHPPLDEYKVMWILTHFLDMNVIFLKLHFSKL
jgi:hypothetical protein